MESRVTCPTCERFITLEDIEAPCQHCGRDMCSHCIRTCRNCGKEICLNCYGTNGLCVLCKNLEHVTTGVNNVRSWDSDSKGILGIGKTIYGTQQYFSEKEKIDSEKFRIKQERLRLELGDEEYYRRVREENKMVMRIIGVIFLIFLIIFLNATNTLALFGSSAIVILYAYFRKEGAPT